VSSSVERFRILHFVLIERLGLVLLAWDTLLTELSFGLVVFAAAVAFAALPDLGYF
jgi:hypothetical protein